MKLIGSKVSIKMAVGLIISGSALIVACLAFVMTTSIRPPTPAGSGNSIADAEPGMLTSIPDGGSTDGGGGEVPISSERPDTLDRRQDFFTVLIAGTDNDGTRTDTMIIAAFDVSEHTVSLLNIPRDTALNVSRGHKKANSSYAVGGIELLKKDLASLLGFKVDRYVIMEFDAFIEIIDAIDGVDIDVPIRMKYDDPDQDLHIDLEPGPQHLDGQAAMEFMRFRKGNKGYPGFPDGDIGRIAANQEFYRAVLDKLINPGTLLKIPSLANIVMENVETDFTTGEIIWMGLEGLKIDKSTISTDTMPGYDGTLPEGGVDLSYYFPREKDLLALINEKFNPNDSPITSISVFKKPASTPKPAETGETDGSGDSGGGEDTEPAAPPGVDYVPVPEDDLPEDDGISGGEGGAGSGESGGGSGESGDGQWE